MKDSTLGYGVLGLLVLLALGRLGIINPDVCVTLLCFFGTVLFFWYFALSN